ncbi:A/G-specific adenine glycosylase [Marinobacter zhanjiangensis]|uniref:Adenine DNA glycosylase n=1 Tax=Marinobacter zhanjiangensis TaxID=578215 RepID=A0ABQ3BA71_9GAMM|nr:A/G-specific adenine glycosylase [Marinobacter zhanjiangensis]GGY80621.1 A/G-specific adenine glycosylase [Marinobacter zhanjiangensis]
MSDRFADRLLQWYDRHGRHDLPWHQDRSPYRVWVSEIMLQQTQVTTVIPYFRAFMERFPTVRELAEAPVDDVLGHWSGLGYYARARNLQKAAIRVMEDHGGEFPRQQDALESLPGIGRSTAAAIIAQAWDCRAAILDGNVKRVLARYHAIPGWPGQTATLNALWQRAEEHTPDARARDYTQAIMDLGAMVCTRSRPDCEHCPVRDGCTAYANGEIHLYPGRKPKKEKPEKTTWMVILEDHDGRILLERRPPSGIWGGLWSLPELDPAFGPDELQDACEQQFGLDCSEPDLISGFRHTFSHYHLHIQPARLHVADTNMVRDDADQRWLHRETALDLGLPAPIRTLLSSPGQAALL